MIVIAAIDNILMLVRERNYVYPLVLSWASFAIYTKNKADYAIGVASLTVAITMPVIVVIYLVWYFVNKKNK